jgi:alcohol dehydrogenase (NADP+)
MSHSPSKKDDTLKLGAKECISTQDKDWAKPWDFTIDFTLNTTDMTHEFNLQGCMSTLAVNGVFTMSGFQVNRFRR